METRKIAVACFIGGFVCYLIAAAFAPMFWWIGLLAGTAAGYVMYDLRGFMIAFPPAFKEACGSFGEVFAKKWNKTVAELTDFLQKKHPFIYAATVIGFIVMYPMMPSLIEGYTPIHTKYLQWNSLQIFAFGIYTSFFTYFLCLAMFTLGVASTAWLLMFFAKFGAASISKQYWRGEFIDRDEEEFLVSMGRSEAPLTYWNAYKWLLYGIIACSITVWTFILALGWGVFRRVHSEKRLLCGIYGAIGGIVSYLYIAPAGCSLAMHLTIVVFGGCLGAFLGVLGRKILSVRLLRVETSQS